MSELHHHLDSFFTSPLIPLALPMGAKVSAAIPNSTSMQRLSLKGFGVLEAWQCSTPLHHELSRSWPVSRFFPPTHCIRHFSPPRGVCRATLSLAVGLTQVGKDLGWGSWECPLPLLWPTSSPLTCCPSWQKEKEKKRKVNGTKYQLGVKNFREEWFSVSRGSPCRHKWKVTGSLFSSSILPRCRTAVSQED